MNEEEKEHDCMFDYMNNMGDLDELINDLNNDQKEHVLRVEARMKVILDEMFRDLDIKRWLKQKQIYFGWHHNYNIKDQKYPWLTNEELRKAFQKSIKVHDLSQCDT